MNLQIDRNIGKTERIVSAIAGSLLMLHGMKRGKKLSEMSLGGYLLFRGATGMCPVKNKILPNGFSGTNLKQGVLSGIKNNLSLNSISDSTHHNINIKSSTTINKPREEVYKFWRKLENLPLFMKHLESVTILDDKTSEWKAKIPGGLGTIKWKSEIVHDAVNERIGWKSLAESEISNAGNVRFSDSGIGTLVEAVISYDPPAGKIGEAVGQLLTPIFESLVKADLEGFKKYMESGSKTTINN
ncbi:MAG: DUF2892 domain-containing protein [Bacteroidota bacterium]|nr:DUF2892 domain-containing protein [Bacteroidota bacterium]